MAQRCPKDIEDSPDCCLKREKRRALCFDKIECALAHEGTRERFLEFLLDCGNDEMAELVDEFRHLNIKKKTTSPSKLHAVPESTSMERLIRMKEITNELQSSFIAFVKMNTEK